MQNEIEKPVLKCSNIVVSARGLAETHGKKIVIFVPAGEIGRITLRFGRAEHSPIFSVTVGAALGLVGVWGLIKFFLAPGGYRYELAMVVLGIIGGSMIFDTFRERYFFEIDKKQGMCRLVFSKNAQRRDIDELCDKIRTVYQYQVSDETRSQ